MSGRQNGLERRGERRDEIERRHERQRKSASKLDGISQETANKPN